MTARAPRALAGLLVAAVLATSGCTDLRTRLEGHPTPTATPTASPSPTLAADEDPLTWMSPGVLLSTIWGGARGVKTVHLQGWMAYRDENVWTDLHSDRHGHARVVFQRGLNRAELRRIGKSYYIRANASWWGAADAAKADRWYRYRRSRVNPDRVFSWLQADAAIDAAYIRGDDRELPDGAVRGQVVKRVLIKHSHNPQIVSVAHVDAAGKAILPVMLTWPKHPGMRATYTWNEEFTVARPQGAITVAATEPDP